MGFNLLKVVAAPFKAVERHVIRPIVKRPMQAAAPIAGFMVGGPAGAALAAGGYSYARYGDARQALGKGAMAYLGAKAGSMAGDKLAKMNQSGGKFVSNAGGNTSSNVGARSFGVGRAGAAAGKIFGEKAGDTIGLGATSVLNNMGEIGTGAGIYMHDKAQESTKQKSLDYQKQIDKTYNEQASNARNAQAKIDAERQDVQARNNKKMARGNRTRAGAIFGDENLLGN